MHELESQSVRPFSVLEIRRAIAHHRRAIQALHDRSSFQGIHAKTAERLVCTLEADLRKLEDELGRRRLGEIRRLADEARSMEDDLATESNTGHFSLGDVLDRGRATVENHAMGPGADIRNNIPYGSPFQGL